MKPDIRPIELLIITLIILIINSCLPGKTEKSSPAVLNNGIVLPDLWPPENTEPPEPVKMEIPPYLQKKPGVICINNGRQLFVDDFLIAETNMERIYYKPVAFSGNPVLKPDHNC